MILSVSYKKLSADDLLLKIEYQSFKNHFLHWKLVQRRQKYELCEEQPSQLWRKQLQ
jgi:hypothetical protein